MFIYPIGSGLLNLIDFIYMVIYGTGMSTKKTTTRIELEAVHNLAYGGVYVRFGEYDANGWRLRQYKAELTEAELFKMVKDKLAEMSA